LPAPFRTCLFVLHKVDPGTVEQIACRQQSDTRLVELFLLGQGELISLIVALGVAQRERKQHRRGDLQCGKKRNNTEDPRQQAKLPWPESLNKGTKNLR